MGPRCLSGRGVISLFLIVQCQPHRHNGKGNYLGEVTMWLMLRRIRRSLLMTGARCMEMTRRRALW